ncbi:MAG TPA: ankyrin repeat domain-containing protein [Gemmatimonadaceae bacterium]|nr:ankyrin repeat domain-containing protein [Gemmatimonadaceae bacterium]
MQSRSLPGRPNLDHLRNEAKALLRTLRERDPATKLTDAQRQLSREYGFPTWAKLREFVLKFARDGGPETVNRVLSAIQSQDLEGALEILREHPAPAMSSIHVMASLGLVEPMQEALASNPELVKQRAGHPPATPLLYACFTPRYRDPEWHALQERTVEALLEAGADPNAKDGRYGVPALYGVTGMHNAPRVARLLLEAGANPTDGESVFHAAEHFHSEALELLREFGVNLNHVGEWGNTPLYFLLRWHDVGKEPKVAQGVAWLLGNGADPNVPCGTERENSLHVAARRGQGPDVVHALLNHGADVNARRGDGATAWRLAKRNGHEEICRLLEKAGATTEPLTAADELLEACGRGDAVAAARLSSPALLASLPRSDRAMLGEAAAAGRARTVEACIAAGFDVNEVNDRAATPLHESAINGYHEVVKALLAANAQLEVRDPEHDATPLGWAVFGADYVRNRDGDYEATIRALVSAGAKRPDTEPEPAHPGARAALGLPPV